MQTSFQRADTLYINKLGTNRVLFLKYLIQCLKLNHFSVSDALIIFINKIHF